MLLLEGSLKYRDQFSAMVVHVFLFTDLILITKATKNKHMIVKPVSTGHCTEHTSSGPLRKVTFRVRWSFT